MRPWNCESVGRAINIEECTYVTCSTYVTNRDFTFFLVIYYFLNDSIVISNSGVGLFSLTLRFVEDSICLPFQTFNWEEEQSISYLIGQQMFCIIRRTFFLLHSSSGYNTIVRISKRRKPEFWGCTSQWYLQYIQGKRELTMTCYQKFLA